MVNELIKNFESQMEDYEILENAAGMAAAFGELDMIEKLEVLKEAANNGLDLKAVSAEYDKISAENKRAERAALRNAADNLIKSLGYDPETLEPQTPDYREVVDEEAEEDSLVADTKQAIDELAEELALQIEDLFFSKK